MAGTEIEARPGITAGEVWDQATGGRELPATVLVSVNLEFSQLGQPVADGDEVAFLPPITGG